MAFPSYPKKELQLLSLVWVAVNVVTLSYHGLDTQRIVRHNGNYHSTFLNNSPAVSSVIAVVVLVADTSCCAVNV